MTTYRHPWRPHFTAARARVTAKPLLRGWIHLVATPLAFAAALVLLILAPTTPTRWASVVYLASTLLLFGVSALYHRLYWGPKAQQLLRRFDHSNIFLLIAGTYTPICVALLEAGAATRVLSIVWIGAALGIGTAVFWPSAPRWFVTPIYVVLGWVALWYLPALWHTGGAAIVWLLIAGGLSYTVGALVYGFKWPNPSPRAFGFHEIFHAFTVAGWVCHCVAAYLAVLTAV
ncbi:PAQR family membrane homeostasis protein TrhA [Gleimia hominis]|uniref:PAQR family membrane homeostasis protein TrhA n=1 Tax=Gleimia hominis TaxID=595468 RepID=UPI000C8061EA|nr:hemolysin III family protein [Gleimia hominis]WIK63723.1 hemolysin III family protein [Gleimia hominis]